MLLSTITTGVVSSSGADIGAGVITMLSPIGLPENGILIVVTLIWLLSAKEILSRSVRWNETLDSSLKMVSQPLLVTFVATIAFKIAFS